jgi:hypothetical protein
MPPVVSNQQGVRSNQWQVLYLLSSINAHNSNHYEEMKGSCRKLTTIFNTMETDA